jgi:transposase
VEGVENGLPFSNARRAAFWAVHGAGTFHTPAVRRANASRVASERMAVLDADQPPETSSGMQVKTILNRIQRYPGFVYGPVRMSGGTWRRRLKLEVTIRPRRRSRPVCSGCHRRGSQYDRLDVRRFEFVPLWGIAVFFLYGMRRVDCPVCGPTVEQVPWADGKHHLTTTYAWFLATWAKRLSWREVAVVFHSTWDTVYRAVTMAVEWGRAHQNLEGITAIGFDEIQWQPGHRSFLTLVYEITAGRRRLLWVGQKRTKQTARQFFKWFGKPRTQALKFVCSDMWAAYISVAAKQAGGALHVLDRFHITQLMNKAIEKVRRAEVRELRSKGRPALLTHARWVLLRRPKNRTAKDRGRLRNLVRHNLKVVRAMLLREDFQKFWTYHDHIWAAMFLDGWCHTVMRSGIDPMKTVVKSLRKHRSLLWNWFAARGEISTAAVEGMNNKAKLTVRKAYGFRSFQCIETALYHTLGRLPEPKAIHRFC